MELMEIRRGLMAQMAGGKIPSFMNHLESGSFTPQSSDVDAYGTYTIQLKDISKPKGILIFSNEFNMLDAKADKPLLGAFASLYIAPPDINNAQIINGWTNIGAFMYYEVNWGTGTDSKFPTYRRSVNEGSRGLYLYNESLKRIQIRGFNQAQSEYDFQFSITYNWLAWD